MFIEACRDWHYCLGNRCHTGILLAEVGGGVCFLFCCCCESLQLPRRPSARRGHLVKHPLTQFNVRAADGEYINMGKYAGDSVLVVNVASECGYTDVNYRQLQVTDFFSSLCTTSSVHGRMCV